MFDRVYKENFNTLKGNTVRKIHPREQTKKARIARAKKYKAMLPTMTMYEIGQAQTPPISTQRVSFLIRSLGHNVKVSIHEE